MDVLCPYFNDCKCRLIHKMHNCKYNHKNRSNQQIRLGVCPIDSQTFASRLLNNNIQIIRI